MQDKTISVLTDKEKQFAADLKLLGVDTKTSRVLTYLCLVGPATSRELELSADMRQPDVSRGIKNIRSFVKTENDDRHLRFSLENPYKVIDDIHEAMLKKRKAEDEAHDRILKALQNKSKPAKSVNATKKSKKARVDDDQELTLRV